MYRDEAGWIKAYTNQDAYWAHSGNPEAPHAELTSGKHSSGFFNSRRIIPNREIHTPSEYALLERQSFQTMKQVDQPLLPAGKVGQLL